MAQESFQLICHTTNLRLFRVDVESIGEKKPIEQYIV